jgi:hypothetical protein
MIVNKITTTREYIMSARLPIDLIIAADSKQGNSLLGDEKRRGDTGRIHEAHRPYSFEATRKEMRIQRGRKGMSGKISEQLIVARA